MLLSYVFKFLYLFKKYSPLKGSCSCLVYDVSKGSHLQLIVSFCYWFENVTELLPCL